jgi:hypothetical protein
VEAEAEAGRASGAWRSGRPGSGARRSGGCRTWRAATAAMTAASLRRRASSEALAIGD